MSVKTRNFREGDLVQLNGNEKFRHYLFKYAICKVVKIYRALDGNRYYKLSLNGHDIHGVHDAMLFNNTVKISNESYKLYQSHFI